jgi:tRNA(Arg) A34 adenosine deaminase TadA
MNNNPNPFMERALAEAKAAAMRGEVPVGALLIDPTSGKPLAADGNRVLATRDPTAHAEMLVLRAAAFESGSERLAGMDLYVTLEPCPMCAAAISLARIRKLVYGAEDPKSGGVEHGPRIFSHSTCHHRPEVVGGVAAAESADLLQNFFAVRRGPKTAAG